MNDRRKFYWLWAAIGLLLLLNLGTIGWIFSRNRQLPRVNRPNPEAILVRRLNLSPEQRSQYQQYRQQFRAQVRPHEDSLRTLRRELFSRIGQSSPDAEVNALISRIEQQNAEILRLRFRHWQRVRQLCTPEQQARFDRLINRLMGAMNRPRQGGQRLREDF